MVLGVLRWPQHHKNSKRGTRFHLGSHPPPPALEEDPGGAAAEEVGGRDRRQEKRAAMEPASYNSERHVASGQGGQWVFGTDRFTDEDNARIQEVCMCSWQIQFRVLQLPVCI